MTAAMASPHTDSVSLVAHYTDAGAVIKILAEGALWASDARYLNDRAEVEFGRSLVREILAGRMEGAGETERAKCETLLAEANATFTFSLPLVTCFSRSIDSLGQWRGYGAGRMRFALEFDEAALHEIVNTEQHFQLVDCVYERKQQASVLTALVDDQLNRWTGDRRPQGTGRVMRIDSLHRRHPGYEEAMDELLRAGAEKRPMVKKHEDVLREIPTGWTDFQWKLSKLLMRLKHPSFSAECEIRAVREHDDGDLMFRGTERTIVPFTELRFRRGNERGALRRVRVGPGIEFNEARPVVERLLFRNFYDGVTVVPSDCTYRD